MASFVIIYNVLANQISSDCKDAINESILELLTEQEYIQKKKLLVLFKKKQLFSLAYLSNSLELVNHTIKGIRDKASEINTILPVQWTQYCVAQTSKALSRTTVYTNSLYKEVL